MIEDEKYDKMKDRRELYRTAGVIATIATGIPSVKNNPVASGVLKTIEYGMPVATIINRIHSFEKYDLSEDGEEWKFLGDFTCNVVFYSIIRSLKMGWDNSSDEYKRDMLKKLNLPSNIIDKLI